MRWLRTPMALALLSTFGCGARTGLPVPGLEPDAARPCPIGPPVDVLLVVDNSSSMAEEQLTLAEQIPALVEALVSPPDLDGDGNPDWFPITNLHLGVVTSDMGGSGYPVGGCERTLGDDGILVNTPSPRRTCDATYPTFLTFDGNRDDREDFVTDVACLSEVGTVGCGFEHILEAPLKAVTPTDSDIVFRGGTGHGDGANAGFLRADSLFALLVLTDEDDCSVLDVRLMDSEDERYDPVMNLRCATNPEALHPVTRYVDGFRALRPGTFGQFAFAVIAGVPPDLAPDPLDIDYERILSDPRMQKRPDDEIPTSLEPSCTAPRMRGSASPPTRLLTMARAFPERAAIQSVCSDDFRPVLLAFARLIANPPCGE